MQSMHGHWYLLTLQVPDQDAQEVNKETKAVVADPDGYKVCVGMDVCTRGPT